MKLIRSKNKKKLSSDRKKEIKIAPRSQVLPNSKQTLSPTVDLDSHNWKVLIVDDEPEVHEITRIVLKGFTFDGKGLELISAYSGEQAREILQNNPHFAAAMIDVVMETEEAGLDLVRFIREEMGLSHIRLIIRTGQPGKAPERFVIDNYDIDDYKEKTDFTNIRMYTMFRSSIKSYRDILTIEKSRLELEQKALGALKQSKKALKKREVFLNTVLDSLTHPFYVIDAANYEITLANQATSNFYNNTRCRTCHAMTHNRNTPCNTAQQPCPLVEMKKTKKPVIVEHIHYDKENTKQIIEVHGFPVLDEQGDLAQMIEYSFDITEKKELEDQLNEALDFQQRIIKYSPIGILIFKENGDCISLNGSAVSMIGGTPDSVRKLNYHNIETWKQSGLYAMVLNTLKDNVSMKFDFSGETLFGKQVDLECFFIPFGKNQLMLMINDISDRKKMEKELKKEIEFNRALADLSRKIISVQSIEEVSMFVLETAKYFTKSPMGYAGYIDPETDHLVSPTLMVDVWDKCRIQEKSYEFSERCGLWGWVLENKRSLYLNDIQDDPRSNGVPKGHVPIERFISVPALKGEKLLGQISLINSSDNYGDADIDILERIANLYSIAIHQKRMLKTLKQSKDEADAANLSKSEFLSNMSHEIRTPMNSVLGFTQLLKNKISDPKQKSYLNSISSSGESLLNIIDEILDLSKIEAGKLELVTKSMDLHSLFKEIRQIFSIQVSQKKVNLIFDIDPNIIYNLFIDELRLKQILTNLISNALKFTHTGYIKVSAQSSPNRNRSIDLILSVEDTGIGIASEFQTKIFEPFCQKDGQDSKKYGGTGLGLTITRNLVEMMGGTISLVSEINKGSTFTLRLKQIKTGSKLSMGNTPNLVVDDSAPCRLNSSETVISKEILTKLPLIIDSLENALMIEWESITQSHHLPDIERFANFIKQLGEKYQINIIIDYGENLLFHSNNFDIENMQYSLNAYPDLIKQIKELSIGGVPDVRL